MSNGEKDRHVLVAAVAADSGLIVSFDLGGFPPQGCEPLGVERIHPDDFLLDLHDLHSACRSMRAVARHLDVSYESVRPRGTSARGLRRLSARHCA